MARNPLVALVALALARSAGAQCAAASKTVDGRRVYFTAAAANEHVCARFCEMDGNRCATAGNPAKPVLGTAYGNGFTCCGGNFVPRCDGNNDCAGANGKCSVAAGGNGRLTAVTACSVDEESCAGLRGALMNGAFAGLVVANRQVTVTSQRAEALMNTPGIHSLGGQINSDFTQETCHDEPTYEAQHRMLLNSFVFTPNASAYTAVKAKIPSFVPASNSPTNCAYPCSGRGCTVMSEASTNCGAMAVDTELIPVLHYKPPENFAGTVTFNARVSTASNAAQQADTGTLPVVMTFLPAACVYEADGSCGANGKCTVQGCECQGSFSGPKCDQVTRKIAPVEGSWNGWGKLFFFVFLSAAIGGSVYYGKTNGFCEDPDLVKTESKELQPPAGVDESSA